MSLHESSFLQNQKTPAGIAGVVKPCPVCSREARDEFVPLRVLEDELQKLIRANAPDTKYFEAVCARCVRLFERAKDQIFAEAAINKEDKSFVLSTPLRLDADERFTGKGVTIAFLDSGFYPHPDLVSPSNRILAYRNLVDSREDLTDLMNVSEPDVASWHGMMTSVVAAGNGSLSNGFYRGIASESDVVLVKLARTGRICDQDILDGLEWVLSNRTKYGIRIVNISAGGDLPQSYLQDSLSQGVEECVRQGIAVVCAVGNAGESQNHFVLPPASSPSAIAVGGLNDDNSINRAKRTLYRRSSYGLTFDGLQKPDLIAPSIWVPAPILPNTPTADQVNLLETLDNAKDEELKQIIAENWGVVPELDAEIDGTIRSIRYIIALNLRKENVINRHYKYVDGTSFATPIVSSVAAQMLEANPNLTPQQIKRFLMETAEMLPLPLSELYKQGRGVIDPRRAVERAISII